MTDFNTLKQNVNSLSNETKISILGLILAVYFLGFTNIIITAAAVLIILIIILVKINDNMIQLIADGAVFLAGSMALLSLYGAAIAFDKTDGILSESYSYPLLFGIFFVSFYLFFVGINKIKENMKYKKNLKGEQKTIGLTLLFCILTILSAASIYIFENPLFLSKFAAFLILGIAIPVFVFYAMYVCLFWKIIPSVKSITWLPYSLFFVNILTLWIGLVHPIGKYFPEIDLTFINVHANDFYELIVAGITVSFLFMISIFLFSKLFLIFQKFIQNQNGRNNLKKMLNEQSSEIKISFYGLITIFFLVITNPIVAIFRNNFILKTGRVNYFITHTLDLKMRLASYDYNMYFTVLLAGLFIGVIIFLGMQIVKKQKITFNFSLFPILFYSLISTVIIFFMFAADAFMFIPLMNPDPYYDDPPIIGITVCLIIFFTIYWYKIKKMSFKPTDILVTACFIFLVTLFTIVTSMPIGAAFGFIYKFSPPLHYLIIKLVSFVLSIFVFEIGFRIIGKKKKSKSEMKSV
ncbi:hypothetical protein MmiHf6_04870 [Methanimicrococcus hongohii]|uniref:Uncharacterized protein n=1 Tax=Methanimicrococcus hongohii TaxID=3028295 RepID=A0AA97A1E0_9EURY|nr:hypothetical protein [Methanimicrococcus sp. Hf6]WNY23183.1 hypothetical protein MmiHf6_04870 [Methanimicrococcus sp. Hf6]